MAMSERSVRALAILFAVLTALFILYRNGGFYHDDAYITLRYARNFIAGRGIVWNPGEYVQGYTNVLQLLLVSWLGELGIDLRSASRVIGVISIAALAAAMLLFRTTNRGDTWARLWHVPVMLVMTSAPLLVWSLGGLEGPLFSLLVAVGTSLLLMDAEAARRRWFLFGSGLAFGLGCLTRPDGIVFVAVSAAWLSWMTWRGRPRTCAGPIAFAVGVVIVVAPYTIWQLSYYGDIVPNTFYAKTGAPLNVRLSSGLRYVAGFTQRPPFLPVLVLAALVYVSLKRAWNVQQAYLVASVVSYVSYVVWVGGDHMQAFRLLLPVVPLMSVLLVMALSPALNANTAIVKYVTVAVVIVSSLQLTDRKLNPRREDPAARAGTIVGKYIANAWPKGSLVALNTAGSTPYHAGQHRYIDMLGLNDPVISRRRIEKIDLPWQRRPGHLKGDGAYVLSRNPDFVIIGPAEGSPVSKPWFLSDLELSRAEGFQRKYALVQVPLDESWRPVEQGGTRRVDFTYYKKIVR
jgi:hypothetical protein